MVYLANAAALDALLASRKPAACGGGPADAGSAAGDTVNAVEFGRDFGVRDQHVIRVVRALGAGLVSLQLGSSDSGDGARLTDAAARAVAGGCPRLEVLRLDSVTGMTAGALRALALGLPRLRELHFTGHDKGRCAVRNKDVDLLRKHPALLPDLTELHITDSSADYCKIEPLCRARPHLTVYHGDTDTDSYAAEMVRAMQGASWGDGLFVTRGAEAQLLHDLENGRGLGRPRRGGKRRGGRRRRGGGGGGGGQDVDEWFAHGIGGGRSQGATAFLYGIDGICDYY